MHFTKWRVRESGRGEVTWYMYVSAFLTLLLAMNVLSLLSQCGEEKYVRLMMKMQGTLGTFLMYFLPPAPMNTENAGLF